MKKRTTESLREQSGVDKPAELDDPCVIDGDDVSEVRGERLAAAASGPAFAT